MNPFILNMNVPLAVFLLFILGFINSACASNSTTLISPKVVVVTLFEPERNAWLSKFSFNQNISIPGGSPLYPYASCDEAGEVCLITTGEGEINAAATLTSFLYHHRFDLTKSYFLVNGIGGISPHAGTIGSVSFARYAIQFGLQFGLDSREMPKDWNYSFWNYGTSRPGQYPGMFYGTEVFEVNTNLREKVLDIVKDVKLADNDAAKANRRNYSFSPANEPPKVLKGDVLTSDLYFTGKCLYVLTTHLPKVDQWLQTLHKY